MSQFQQELVAKLLKEYNFDLEFAQVETIAVTWLDRYPVERIVSAIVQAIYLQRYKAISVTNILLQWENQAQPRVLYDQEYERGILDKLVPQPPPPMTEDFDARRVGAELPQQKVNYDRTDSKLEPESRAVIINEELEPKPNLRGLDRNIDDRARVTKGKEQPSEFFYKLKAIVEGSNNNSANSA
jgi:hypothetical protein